MPFCRAILTQNIVEISGNVFGSVRGKTSGSKWTRQFEKKLEEWNIAQNRNCFYKTKSHI